ncbi:PREDICTED: uncharacterized protein LOC104814702 [Tarenaya hassleriana]|uniref:uncharacterized protein LOC104814702 n=1 Tax=Tarenaya hassleriana TaxID=28532 RepID=UPI00053C16FF|nr:PREDICTED: uncharacterized protein LOC104814702 [Tarenaya hassleriana]
MAVQAQHPSNGLFPNRNGQEGHGFSLQPQQGEFLDQTHMLLNNGGSNPGKRGVESTAPQVNSYHFSQSPQVIGLSLLHSQHYHRPPAPASAPNIVSTGLRLSSGEDQPQNFNGRLRQQYRCENQNLVSSSSSGVLSVLYEDFDAQISRQREEIDEFLHAQAEGLRRTLANKRQRHYSALLRAVEEPLARKLREKEAEVESATRRREGLEARAAQLTAEAQAWQARARAHEAAGLPEKSSDGGAFAVSASEPLPGM